MDTIELLYEARLWADRIRPEHAERAQAAIEAADREVTEMEARGEDVDVLQPRMVRLVDWLERRARDTTHERRRR